MTSRIANNISVGREVNEEYSGFAAELPWCRWARLRVHLAMREGIVSTYVRRGFDF